MYHILQKIYWKKYLYFQECLPEFLKKYFKSFFFRNFYWSLFLEIFFKFGHKHFKEFHQGFPKTLFVYFFEITALKKYYLMWLVQNFRIIFRNFRKEMLQNFFPEFFLKISLKILQRFLWNSTKGCSKNSMRYSFII